MFAGIGMPLQFRRGAAAPSYSAEATAYFAAMSSQPSDARKVLINALIAGLKTDGVWSKLDLFYLLASHDAQSARVNAKTPASNTITETATVTFTADRGYMTDGDTGYLDTNFNPATAGGNWSRHSASLFSWVNSTTRNTPSSLATSAGNTAATITSLHRTAGDVFGGRLNASTTSAFGLVTTRVGSRCLSRTASTTTNAQVDGAESGSASVVASAALTSQNIFLLRQATRSNECDRLACAALGGGLSGAEMTALHNRVSTYLTAIEAAVMSP